MQGLGVGMVEEGITSGLGFMAYEIGQQVFTNITGRSPTTGERGIIGGFTACLNMGASLPLVLIQRKMQVRMYQRVKSNLETSNTLKIFKLLHCGVVSGYTACRNMSILAPVAHSA